MNGLGWLGWLACPLPMNGLGWLACPLPMNGLRWLAGWPFANATMPATETNDNFA